MENTLDEIRQYLGLRRAAEEYYRSHPSVAALLNELHDVAPDKLGISGRREASMLADLAERTRASAGSDPTSTGDAPIA